jgi:pyruvate kinase
MQIKEVCKNFVRHSISSVRFVVTKAKIEDHISFVEKFQDIYSDESGHKLEVMLDLPLPKDKIRIVLPANSNSDSICVEQGELLSITNDYDLYMNGDNNDKLFFVDGSFEKVRDEITIIGDGDLLMETVAVENNKVVFRCLDNAEIRRGKAIASPSGYIKKTSESIYDKALNIVDILRPPICVLSYVEVLDDIASMKRNIFEKFGYTPQLMSKIECQKALDNADDIIFESDSIMIARGCLAVNVGIERLALAQDRITRLCMEYQKNVCIASNILRSIALKNWPTRADIMDLTHMILSGLRSFIITDSFCMTNRFDKLMYFINNTYAIYGYTQVS